MAKDAAVPIVIEDGTVKDADGAFSVAV